MCDRQGRTKNLSGMIHMLSAKLSRVWAWVTDRKAIFYPLNWLKPDQRDDKSPLFKEVDDELLGTDITRTRNKLVHKNVHKEID